MSILDTNEVNTGRQKEIDLAKAVVIFFLATIHVYVECSTDLQLWGGLPYLFDSIVGGPWAAPMFIFSMGIGLAYTPKNTPRDLFLRGLNIALVGFLLNICRFLIPSLVGYAITGDGAMYLEDLPYKFFGNDLLQFAALAMLFMAFLKWLKLSPWKIFFVALAINIIAMFLNNLYFDNMVLNIFLGHFIGIDDGTETVVSDFPVMIWFLMYACGLVYGGILRRMKDKKRFYKYVSVPCLLVTIAVYIFQYVRGFGMMGGPGANVFYHLTTPEIFLCIGTEFGMLGIYYMITERVSDKVMDMITAVSRSVTIVYFIQWTLVMWVTNVLIYIAFGSKYLDSWKSLIVGLVLSFASVILAEQWVRFQKKRKEKREP